MSVFPVRYNPAPQRHSVRRLGLQRIDNWVGQHCISLPAFSSRINDLQIWFSGTQTHSHVNKKQREAFKRLRCLVFRATAMQCLVKRTRQSFCILPFRYDNSLKVIKDAFHTELLCFSFWTDISASLRHAPAKDRCLWKVAWVALCLNQSLGKLSITINET